MIEAFSIGNTGISRKIFIHIPTEICGSQFSLTTRCIDEILATDDKELRKIVARIAPGYSVNDFVANLIIEFGPSLDEIESEAKSLLNKYLGDGIDVDGLAYPNALSIISIMSSKKDVQDRKLSRSGLIDRIRASKDLTISRWIRFTKAKNAILKRLRIMVAAGLSANSQRRILYIDSLQIKDIHAGIVQFIANFVDKYHYKPAHIHPPIVLIDENSLITCDEIIGRLFHKGITAENGMAGNKFFIQKLIRQPMRVGSGTSFSSEFRLRVCDSNHMIELLQQYKPDHLFVIGDSIPESLVIEDVKTYQISVDNFQDLEFVLSIGGSPSED